MSGLDFVVFFLDKVFHNLIMAKDKLYEMDSGCWCYNEGGCGSFS